jgi:quinol monooxygenase YgiN
MTPPSTVSIHPYFKAHPGKIDAALALLPRFVERTRSETDVLYYEFTVSEDVIFCREAYPNAEGALAHLTNVDTLLKEMLSISDLIRLEFHGPATELAKLKEPLKELPVIWFELRDRLEV